MRPALLVVLLAGCAPQTLSRECAFGAETDAMADYCCQQNFGKNFKAEEPRSSAGCAHSKATALSKE